MIWFFIYFSRLLVTISLSLIPVSALQSPDSQIPQTVTTKVLYNTISQLNVLDWLLMQRVFCAAAQGEMFSPHTHWQRLIFISLLSASNAGFSRAIYSRLIAN